MMTASKVRYLRWKSGISGVKLAMLDEFELKIETNTFYLKNALVNKDNNHVAVMLSSNTDHASKALSFWKEEQDQLGFKADFTDMTMYQTIDQVYDKGYKIYHYQLSLGI
tara:strand:- start:274 stop:603 length:330 start_codon:yes stop_codon:yes gene_type:complete